MLLKSKSHAAATESAKNSDIMKVDCKKKSFDFEVAIAINKITSLARCIHDILTVG